MLGHTSKILRSFCPQINKDCVFASLNFNLRYQHDSSTLFDENKQEEGTYTTTYKKKRKYTFITPHPPSKVLKNVNNMSSIIVTNTEIALVKMTKDLHVKKMTSNNIKLSNLNNSYQYFRMLHPIVEQCKSSDMCILEYTNLPPSYSFINTQQRNVKFMLSGMLDSIEALKVYQMTRINTAKLFNLAFGQNRICGKNLAFEIIRNGKWKDNEITIPAEILTEKVYADGQEVIVKKPLSSPVTDAFLQAIAFWSYQKNPRDIEAD